MSDSDQKISYYSRSAAQVLEALAVEQEQGLADQDADGRLQRHGANKLRHAVTISFLTLAFGKLWFVFNLRRVGSSFFHNDIAGDPYVAGAIAPCAVLLLAAVYLPGLSNVLKTENPTGQGWLAVLTLSLVPFVFGQLLQFCRPGHHPQPFPKRCRPWPLCWPPPTWSLS